MRTQLALSSWSAVSAMGIGAEEFTRALLTPATGVTEPSPLGRAVPDFDIPRLLGNKNTRAMDRITGLTVVAVGRLLAGEQTMAPRPAADGTGMVLGITTGSVQSMMDFTRDSLTRPKPYLVDPARFPNGVMNRAAGQSAIWYGLRGPNATIASGQVAGLSTLRYAARLHRHGHATSILCGAVEELSEQRAWLERERQDGLEPGALGEGCAVFRLEPAEHAAAHGRTVLAYLAATAFRVYLDRVAVARTLTECLSEVLAAAGAAAAEVWAVATDLPEHEHAGLTEPLGHRPRLISLQPVLGDAGAASSALLLSATLVHAQADADSRGRIALVAAADRDGLVGVAAIRLPSAGKGLA